ncbi:unnamed protein product [Symbiodinium natans]|uniref:Uncharacterized protein n=1 Tax=Symbiodinium natans TaxID=878477 RepID=A0A812TD85_9DINO|nr:unnamed protein product [Symbiodinium natans]
MLRKHLGTRDTSYAQHRANLRQGLGFRVTSGSMHHHELSRVPTRVHAFWSRSWHGSTCMKITTVFLLNNATAAAVVGQHSISIFYLLPRRPRGFTTVFQTALHVVHPQRCPDVHTDNVALASAAAGVC